MASFVIEGGHKLHGEYRALRLSRRRAAGGDGVAAVAA